MPLEKNATISLRSMGQFCLFYVYQERWFRFLAKVVCFVWPHTKMIPQQCCTEFKESTNVLLSPSLQTQIQLCSWKWREQALILGKTTIIPLSIAFTLVYLALLVCYCTATWQYDTFTFWLETNPAQTPGWKPKNNDGIATDEQQSPLQKPVHCSEGDGA